MPTDAEPPLYKRPWTIVSTIVMLVAGLWYFSHRSTPATDSSTDMPSQGGGRSGSGRMDPSKRPSSVGTAVAGPGDIHVYQTGLGTAVPRNVVTVHTRVDGELVKVQFQEGQIVKAGDLLAQVDPRPYQVVLTQARGQLARDSALLKNAQLDYERYKTLLAQDSTSQQQLDTQAALVRQYQGGVEADQGQVDSANLSLSFTRITAPIGGRAGLRQVDAGNIVHASDPNGIVVITQIQPMTVIFAVPETRIARIVKKLREKMPVQVEAWDRDNKNKLASGMLAAADNQVDTTTGTVKLRAEFPNQDYALFANQFVNARALIETRTHVITIPSAAVQVGNAGSFVYVVQLDSTVKVSPVTPGIADGSIVEITEGLSAGQTVVVDGLDRLRDGMKVITAGAPAAGQPGSGQPVRRPPAGAAGKHWRHTPADGTGQPSS